MQIDKSIFRYSKILDTKIKRAVEDVLGIKVKKAIRIKQGEVNHVYKIITESKNYIARIFQYGSWPEPTMLPWIEGQLAKHKISHAKILYYSRDSKFFPFGFMVTQFIDGLNGVLACDRRKLTRAQAFYHIGAALKKVHRIKIKKFGEINNGRGNFKSFLQWKLRGNIRGIFKALEPTGRLSAVDRGLVEKRVRQCFRPFEKSFVPVLNHGDPNRENAIWSDKKQWVLIDWDNAISSTWMEDFADVSFWMSYKRTKAAAAKRRKIYIKNFFKGYGEPDFNWNEIKQIEPGLHIIKCLKLLFYYYFEKKDASNFKAAKNMLISLLKA